MKTIHRRPRRPGARALRRERRLLEGVAIFVLFILIIGAFALSGLQHRLLRSQQAAAVISAVLVDLANRDRHAASLGTLELNPTLTAAAQAKADDMAAKSYFAHVSPEGRDPWYWFTRAGYNFEYAGENLAVDFNDSNDVNSAWMNSPSHRENILDPHFTQIGIAIAQGMYQGHPTTFVVQEFGSPAESVSPAPPIAEVTPEDPTQPALATTDPVNVLGSSSTEPATPVPAQKPTPKPVVVVSTPIAPEQATTTKALSAAPLSDVRTQTEVKPIGAVRYAPAWGYLATSPKSTLRYVYYLLGILILAALAIETGFEIRWHHVKRAFAAGTLLATMCVLFIAADYLYFAEPVLAASAALIGAS